MLLLDRCGVEWQAGTDTTRWRDSLEFAVQGLDCALNGGCAVERVPLPELQRRQHRSAQQLVSYEVKLGDS